MLRFTLNQAGLTRSMCVWLFFKFHIDYKVHGPLDGKMGCINLPQGQKKGSNLLDLKTASNSCKKLSMKPPYLRSEKDACQQMGWESRTLGLSASLPPTEEERC